MVGELFHNCCQKVYESCITGEVDKERAQDLLQLSKEAQRLTTEKDMYETFFLLQV